VSHDLGVIGQVADSVTVLHSGEAVEQAPVLDNVRSPSTLHS
jgi:peptide/nickel transport system ATP-binding protein